MVDMQRFADVINRRRRELGLSLASVAAANGPSEPTMVRIESGQSPPLRNPTLAKLDVALKWPAGSARNVYQGGDPLVSEQAGTTATHGEIAVAVGTITDLVETVTELSNYTAAHPDPELGEVLARLRYIVSPLVGRVVADMLRDENRHGVAPNRIAEAIQVFLDTPPADVTPSRTAANTELRRLAARTQQNE